MKLNKSVKDICEIIGGTTTYDLSFIIDSFTSLEKATDKDISILLDPQSNSISEGTSLLTLEKSKAPLIIASKPWVDNKNYILVNNPIQALQKIHTLIEPYRPTAQNDEYFIHSKACIAKEARLKKNACIDAFAVIESYAEIGENSRVGAHSYIGPHVMIGKNVSIGPHVTILERTIIGDNVSIDSGTVIGTDGFGYQFNKNGITKIPHIGIVYIENNVEIGSNCSIDRALFDKTYIGTGSKIDNQVNIAHNVHIGKHTIILGQTAIAGSVKIGDHCQIGGQVGIKDHVTIDNGAKIVSKSGILKSVAKNEIVAGCPAVPFSLWKKICVVLPYLPHVIKNSSGAVRNHNPTTKKTWWKRLIGI